METELVSVQDVVNLEATTDFRLKQLERAFLEMRADLEMLRAFVRRVS